MCPLRVILLFLSAILAGYFAIKTVRAQGESSILDVTEEEPEKAIEQTDFFTKVSTGVSSFFWVTIDILSGRYLYHNLKGQAKGMAVADDEPSITF
jgi:hypothetical protein